MFGVEATEEGGWHWAIIPLLSAQNKENTRMNFFMVGSLT
jgi:hypothetical protein